MTRSQAAKAIHEAVPGAYVKQRTFGDTFVARAYLPGRSVLCQAEAPASDAGRERAWDDLVRQVRALPFARAL